MLHSAGTPRSTVPIAYCPLPGLVLRLNPVAISSWDLLLQHHDRRLWQCLQEVGHPHEVRCQLREGSRGTVISCAYLRARQTQQCTCEQPPMLPVSRHELQVRGAHVALVLQCMQWNQSSSAASNAFLPAPCRFPGDEASYSNYIELCDADILAEGMVHCATIPGCANRAFNVRHACHACVTRCSLGLTCPNRPTGCWIAWMGTHGSAILLPSRRRCRAEEQAALHPSSCPAFQPSIWPRAKNASILLSPARSQTATSSAGVTCGPRLPPGLVWKRRSRWRCHWPRCLHGFAMNPPLSLVIVRLFLGLVAGWLVTRPDGWGPAGRGPARGASRGCMSEQGNMLSARQLLSWTVQRSTTVRKCTYDHLPTHFVARGCFPHAPARSWLTRALCGTCW